jgi:hypothetical protein
MVIKYNIKNNFYKLWLCSSLLQNAPNAPKNMSYFKLSFYLCFFLLFFIFSIKNKKVINKDIFLEHLEHFGT